MRLGIDARPLQGETRFRGIGKTLQNVLEAVAEITPKDIQFTFYIDPDYPEPETLLLFPGSRKITVKSSGYTRKKYIRAFFPRFSELKPKTQDIDVLLQYDASLGVPKDVPTIAIFYDLIPFLFKDKEKEAQKPKGGVRKLKHGAGKRIHWHRYIAMLNRFKHAKHIISISAAARKDLLQFMPSLSPSAVTPVLLGTKLLVAPKSVRKEIESLASNDYILYVGGIDVRKNIVGLLQDFIKVKLSHPNLKLLVVGKEFELTDHLEDLGWNQLLRNKPDIANDVIIPGFISDDELRYLYNHALIFTFPSRYEGFGLPILEAMQQGCPVITYRNSSLIEVAGDAAMIVADGESIAKPVMELLGNRVLRQELIIKGKAHVQNFTWDKTAQKTLEIVRKVYSNAV